MGSEAHQTRKPRAAAGRSPEPNREGSCTALGAIRTPPVRYHPRRQHGLEVAAPDLQPVSVRPQGLRPGILKFKAYLNVTNHQEKAITIDPAPYSSLIETRARPRNVDPEWAIETAPVRGTIAMNTASYFTDAK